MYMASIVVAAAVVASTVAYYNRPYRYYGWLLAGGGHQRPCRLLQKNGQI